MPCDRQDDRGDAYRLRGLISRVFQDDLESFMCTRMDRLNPRLASVEFAEADDMAEQLLVFFDSYLPEEAKNKLDEYAEVKTLRDTILTELFYRHGFADGVMMIVQALSGRMDDSHPDIDRPE